MKSVVYYMMPISPWTYLGHQRFAAIAKRHGAAVDLRPFDLTRVFPVSGGLPLGQRPIQRRNYRMFELERWSAHLGVPLNREPKHFPVAPHDAAKLIIVANRRAGIEKAMAVAGGLLAACWAEERDVSDPDTLVAVAQACGLDGRALVDALPEADPDYERFTQSAIDEQVFGAPWYVVGSEPFWGQDRLEFVDRALAG